MDMPSVKIILVMPKKATASMSGDVSNAYVKAE